MATWLNHAKKAAEGACMHEHQAKEVPFPWLAKVGGLTNQEPISGNHPQRQVTAWEASISRRDSRNCLPSSFIFPLNGRYTLSETASQGRLFNSKYHLTHLRSIASASSPLAITTFTQADIAKHVQGCY